MKPRKSRRRRFLARLQPGRIMRLKPQVLRAMGWNVDDGLVFSFRGAGALTVFKKPTEREWRVDRLTRRLNGSTFDRCDRCPPTFAAFRALGHETK